jgi:hypothetical protein
LIKLYFNIYNQQEQPKTTVTTVPMATTAPIGSELSGMSLVELVDHIERTVRETVNDYPDSDETIDYIRLFMIGVAKLSAYQHQGLGAILYARWLEFDKLDDIMAKLREPYSESYTYEDLIEKRGLESILWLKLAVMCNVKEAIRTYADMLSTNGEWDEVPDSAIRNMDNLIPIANCYDRCGATILHRFVIVGVNLIADAYSIHKPVCEITRTYRFYVELTHAINKGTIPYGLIHGHDGHATTTREMAEFLVGLLEGGQPNYI